MRDAVRARRARAAARWRQRAPGRWSGWTSCESGMCASSSAACRSCPSATRPWRPAGGAPGSFARGGPLGGRAPHARPSGPGARAGGRGLGASPYLGPRGASAGLTLSPGAARPCRGGGGASLSVGQWRGGESLRESCPHGPAPAAAGRMLHRPGHLKGRAPRRAEGKRSQSPPASRRPPESRSWYRGSFCHVNSLVYMKDDLLIRLIYFQPCASLF